MPAVKQFDETEALEKAMLTFWERGFNATSMQDLVDAMGIQRGSLYATFGDKQKLFMSALKFYNTHYRQAPMAMVEAEFSPLETIDQWFQLAVSINDQEKNPKGCLIANTALEMSQHDEEVATFLNACQDDIIAFFERNLSAAKDSKELAAHLNVDATAKRLMATLFGMFVLSRGGFKVNDLTQIATSTLASLPKA